MIQIGSVRYASRRQERWFWRGLSTWQDCRFQRIESLEILHPRPLDSLKNQQFPITLENRRQLVIPDREQNWTLWAGLHANRTPERHQHLLAGNSRGK